MSCFFAQEVPNGHMPLLAVSYKGVSDKILGVLYSPNTIWADLQLSTLHTVYAEATLISPPWGNGSVGLLSFPQACFLSFVLSAHVNVAA